MDHVGILAVLSGDCASVVARSVLGVVVLLSFVVCRVHPNRGGGHSSEVNLCQVCVALFLVNGS